MFESSLTDYANLRIRLKHDKITQKDFFCYLVNCYINSDIRMAEMIEDLKEVLKKLGRSKREKSHSEILAGKSLLEDYGFTEKDKKNIYDLIEKEYDEEF